MKDTTLNSVAQVIRQLGDWVGLGSMFDDLFTGERGTIEMSEVTGAINKLVQAARSKGQTYVQKLEQDLNKIYQIPMIGGNIKSVVSKAQDILAKELATAKTSIDSAEQRLSQAADKASEIASLSKTQKARTNSKYKSGSTAENIMSQALNYANEAKKIYNELGEKKLS